MSSRKRHLTAFLIALLVSGILFLLVWHSLTGQSPMAQPQQKIVPLELAELAARSPRQAAPQPPEKADMPPATPQDSRPPKAETPQPRPRPTSSKPKPSPQPVAKPKPKSQTSSKPAVTKSGPTRSHIKAKPRIQQKPPKSTAKAMPKPTRPATAAPQPATPAAPKPPIAAPQPPAATSSAPAVDPGVKRRYLERLRRTIAQLAQDSYPYRARRRGQQGTVTLRFTIHANGRITHLSLAATSGFHLLDEAALAVIDEGMQRHFEPFPDTLRLPRLEVTIPIRYRLR